MSTKIHKVQFAFRLIIDAKTTSVWEKYVLEATYREYYLQEQLFQDINNKVDSFMDLKRLNPKAEQLHYLVGMSAIHYIEQLKGNLYQIKDNLNKNHLKFINFEIDIINSSNKNFHEHKIGITFYTQQYYYFGEVNNCYLVAENTENLDFIQTMMIPNRPFFSISSISIKDE